MQQNCIKILAAPDSLSPSLPYKPEELLKETAGLSSECRWAQTHPNIRTGWDFRATNPGCIYLESLQSFQEPPEPCTCSLKAFPSDVLFGGWVRVKLSCFSTGWQGSSSLSSWGCPGTRLVLKFKIKLYSRDVWGDSLGCLSSLLCTITRLGGGWNGLYYYYVANKGWCLLTLLCWGPGGPPAPPQLSQVLGAPASSGLPWTHPGLQRGTSPSAWEPNPVWKDCREIHQMLQWQCLGSCFSFST